MFSVTLTVKSTLGHFPRFVLGRSAAVRKSALLASVAYVGLGLVGAAHATPVVIEDNFVKAGISDYGTLGSDNTAPPGIMYDPTGHGNYGVTDFLTPGDPFEGFYISAITATGSTYFQGSNNNPGHGTITFGSSSAPISLNATSASWTGISYDGSMTVTNQYSLATLDGQSVIAVATTLTNTGTSALSGLDFLRTLDPDPDVYTNNNYVTDNSVVSPSVSCGSSLLTSHTICIGTTSTLTHMAGVSAAWSTDPRTYLTGVNDGYGDYAIGLAFSLGNLAAGGSTTFGYYYALGPDLTTASRIPGGLISGAEITTNQFASPCINSTTGSCSGGAANILQSGDVTIDGTLSIGTTGIGALTIGSATLTAASLWVGNSSTVDVHSGGQLVIGSGGIDVRPNSTLEIEIPAASSPVPVVSNGALNVADGLMRLDLPPSTSLSAGDYVQLVSATSITNGVGVNEAGSFWLTTPGGTTARFLDYPRTDGVATMTLPSIGAGQYLNVEVANTATGQTIGVRVVNDITPVTTSAGLSSITRTVTDQASAQNFLHAPYVSNAALASWEVDQPNDNNALDTWPGLFLNPAVTDPNHNAQHSSFDDGLFMETLHQVDNPNTIYVAIRGTEFFSGPIGTRINNVVADSGFAGAKALDIVSKTIASAGLVAGAAIAAELAAGLTKLKQYVQEASDYLVGVIRDNPGADITITGHSLGGGVAQILGYVTGMDTVTFNPAPAGSVIDLLGDATKELWDWTPSELPANLVCVRAYSVSSSSNPWSSSCGSVSASNIINITEQSDILTTSLGGYLGELGRQVAVVTDLACESAGGCLRNHMLGGDGGLLDILHAGATVLSYSDGIGSVLLDISGSTSGSSVDSIDGSGGVLLGTQTLTLTGASGTVGGTISGTGGLWISGGTETLTGTNTYTGLTIIDAGDPPTLVLSGLGSISASSRVVDNGIFDISSTLFGASIQSLSGSGEVVLGTQTLTITNANDTFSGVIDGTGSLAITGGVETLTGVNTYSGGTVVEGGTLSISSDANLGNGGVLALMNGATLIVTASGTFTHDVTVAGDPTFNVASGTTVSWTGLISDGATPGDVVVTGGGTFEPLNPANSYSGGTSVIGGSTILVLTDGKLGAASGGLTLGDATTGGTLKLSGSFDLADNRPFNLGAGGGTVDTNSFDMTVSQGIGGNGPLTKAGTGVLTFAGANAYTGLTTISDGTLALSAGGDVAASAGIADNAIFDISGTNAGASIKTLSGNGIVTLGTQTLTLTNASDTFAGVIGGSGGVTVTAGTETLTGVNTYTGVTAITGGTLALNGNGSIAASSDVTDNATIDISGTNAGAAITSLSGAGAVILGSQTLALTYASDTFAGVISGMGGVTFAAGTEVLTGANTYTGMTTISGGTLALNGNGSLAASSGVADSGTFDISATNSGASIQSLSGNGSVVLGSQSLTLTNALDTFAGTIGGSGALNVAGGVETLTGVNTYTGGTTVSGGALQLGNGGTTGSVAGNVTDNALLAFNRSDTMTFVGAISGTGAVMQLGSGTTILTAANSYAGGTAIAAGTLQVGNGGTTGSITGNVANYGTLAFMRSDSVIFAGIISGSGGVQQNGAGTLILNAISTDTGPTRVNAGTLAVNGSIAASSNLTVNAGATLAGTGTVPTTAVLAGGTIAPGNGGVGTLHVNGNLVLSSGSAYSVETTPAANDVLSVTGSASVAGTLAVTPTGSYSYNQTITVVSAPGGVTGGFEALTTGDFGFNLVAVLGYGPNSAFLVLEPNAISPLLPTSASVNETNVAAAIDVAMAKDGERALFSPLANLSAGDLSTVLSQLSGELPNGAAHAGFTIAGSFLETMLDPLVDGRGDTDTGASALSFLSNPVREAVSGQAGQTPVAGSISRQPLTFWGAALGGWANTQGDTQLGTHSTNASDGALVLGADFRPDNGDTVVGVAGSIGQTWWHVATGPGSGHSDVRQVGVYGSTRFDQFYLSGSAALAFFTARTARSVTFGGDNLYIAKFHAQSEGGKVEVGRRFLIDDDLGLTPYINLQAVQFRTPTFVERPTSGSPQFALAYSKNTQSNVTHEIGVQLDDTLSVGADTQIDLHARAGWLHDYSSSLSELADFDAFPDAAFIVHGASQAKDAARLSVGLEAGIADGFVFQLKAQSELSSTWQTYGGNVRVAYHW